MGTDRQYNADETWRITLDAFRVNLLFYKAIGSAVHVHHWERTGGFLGLFWDWRWVSRPATSIDITNSYYGPTASRAEAAGLGTCSNVSKADLDCRLWSAGAGIKFEESRTAPGTYPPGQAGGAILDVRGVVATATVRVDGRTYTLTAREGQFGPGELDQGLSSAGGQGQVGTRITCVRLASGGTIEAIGGTGADGSSWSLSVPAAVAAILRGHAFHVERPAGDMVRVVVATSEAGRPYIKTEADGDIPNNLLSLPRCP